MFVVIEGLDGAGKTTIIKDLEFILKYREGFEKVYCTAEPTPELLSGMITRIILRSKEKYNPLTYTLYFFADRIEHWSKIIKEKVRNGYLVISERYFYSTLAYQSVLGVDEKFLESLTNYLISNEIIGVPDVSIYIDVDPEICMRRLGNRKSIREVFEKLEFLNEVRKKYLELAKKFDMYIIENNGEDKDKVVEEICSIIKKCLRKRK